MKRMHQGQLNNISLDARAGEQREKEPKASEDGMASYFLFETREGDKLRVEGSEGSKMEGR